MASDEARPIPREDRKREQIAARYAERQRSRYDPSTTAAPPEPDTLPVYLSAAEVIGLIAYGRSTATTVDAPGEPAGFFERWQSRVIVGEPNVVRHYPLVAAMRIALIRVAWWKRQKRATAPWRRCPIKPMEWRRRASVRAALRRNEGNALEILARLKRDVGQKIAARAIHGETLERACTVLCAEVAAGNVRALGRKGRWRARRCTGTHEALPREHFANPHVTILVDGWATCSPTAPIDEWLNWAGPDWGDLRFERDEVLRFWPVERVKPMTVKDLPAAWSLIEAVCWIMFRDAGKVRETAPETRAGSKVTGVRLDILQAMNPGSMRSADAREGLLEALRAGTICATATTPHGRVTMQPLDWRGLGLSADAIEGYVAEGKGVVRPQWRGVMVEKVAVLALWPAAGATAEIDMPAAPEAGDIEARTFAAMLKYAQDFHAQTGKPPKRDPTVAAGKAETGYPIRKGRKLYPKLPIGLRIPPRS